MEWLMIVLVMTGSPRPALTTAGPFATEQLCEDAGKKVVPALGKPITTYVCVRSK